MQRRIGPAWTDRGRPAAGYFTKRTAEDWLRDLLGEARRGTLPGLVKTGVTFSEAADEWLRYVEHDRNRKHSTIVGYQAILNAQLIPAFGDEPVESITTEMIESWISGVDRAPATRAKTLVLLHGIFKRARKVYRLPTNPAAEVEKPPIQQSGNIEVWRWLMTTQVAEVPGAISEGKTRKKARANVIDALDVCSTPEHAGKPASEAAS